MIDALVRLRANPKQRRQRGTQLTCAERWRTCAVCHANDTYDRCARDGGGGGSDRTQSGGSAARKDGRAALSACARRGSAGIGSDRRKRITMFGLKSNQLCSCAPPHTPSPVVSVCARAAAADASDQSEPTFCRCAAPAEPAPSPKAAPDRVCLLARGRLLAAKTFPPRAQYAKFSLDDRRPRRASGAAPIVGGQFI